jgi:thiol-disulfide isomerase/thioredoxin
VLPFLFLVHLAGSHAVVIGEHVPDRPVPGLDGKPIELTKLDTTVVTFFATWCGPCHQAIADLLAIRQRGPHFTLVLIAVTDSPARVRGYLKEQSIPDDVVVGLDSTATISRAWGQNRLPTTFLVDRSRILRHINRGYGRGYRARVEAWLQGMHAAK